MTALTLPARQDAASAARQPLVVDLDGTLLRSDTLLEGLLLGATTRPLQLARALAGARSRAGLKQAVAAVAPLDPALLPYDEDFLAYLRDEQKTGRPLILATAADRGIALAIARHLDLFDIVLASDGRVNLKGRHKVAAIHTALPGQAFAYAGDAHADIAVWRAADSAVLVNPKPGVARSAAAVTRVDRAFNGRPHWAAALLDAMRPHQWVKNLLVFVPILTARGIDDVGPWLNALLMFLAFCCTASGIYLVNDLCDLFADRQHAKKRARALASGALPLPLAMLAAPLLILAGFGLSLAVDSFMVLFAYTACSLAYSLGLKSQPLVDVFLLAGLYTLRVIGGGLAAGPRYNVSLWLLAFSSFLFLSLALVKRVAELQMHAGSEKRCVAGRGYRPDDLRILELMGVAASFVTSLVLALYVQNELVNGDRYPSLAWAIVPLMLFWHCRIWLVTARGEMHHDPILFAVRDRISWLVAAVVLGVVLAGAKFPIPAG